MALAQTTFFELCHGTVQRIVTGMLTSLGNSEMRTCCQQLVNVQGVIFPIGSNVQRPAGSQLSGRTFQEIRLKYASLVVPFFWPGIRKVQIDPVHAAIRNLPLEYLLCIMQGNPQIREL